MRKIALYLACHRTLRQPKLHQHTYKLWPTSRARARRLSCGPHFCALDGAPSRGNPMQRVNLFSPEDMVAPRRGRARQRRRCGRVPRGRTRASEEPGRKRGGRSRAPDGPGRKRRGCPPPGEHAGRTTRERTRPPEDPARTRRGGAPPPGGPVRTRRGPTERRRARVRERHADARRRDESVRRSGGVAPRGRARPAERRERPPGRNHPARARAA
jgi:hypothetical protein